MISKHSKWTIDKLAPTSQSTVATLQGSCSISTYGEQSTTIEEMKIKKQVQLFSPLVPVGNTIVNNANEIHNLMCNRGTYVSAASICHGISYPIMYTSCNVK